MENIELNVEVRDKLGSAESRRIRKLGFIPGVLYGKDEKPIHLKVSLQSLQKVVSRGENVIISLKVGHRTDGERKTVMIKEIQIDPVEDEIVHVDFYKVSLREEVTIKVPIETEGDAKGVKEKGGVLDQILRELEVKCLPKDIPEKITIDVSELDIGHSYTVEKLKIPAGVEVLTPIDSTVVTVIAPTVLEEEKKREEEITEPELIKKPKEKEEVEEVEPEEVKERRG